MDFYIWIKVLHILAVISWMAGLLYLPRLFVYHADQVKGSPVSDQFEIMEYRLLRYIMNPAMITAWMTGLWLAWSGGYLGAGWFHGKLLAVAAMSGVHMFLAGERRRISEAGLRRASRFYRIVNEVPTVLMIFIVVFVVVKPF